MMYNISVFLDSSAVEHSAVNRKVTGSNPVQGVFLWPVSRVVKMPPFHGGDQGFDTPTGYVWYNMFDVLWWCNGSTEVFGAFSWSSNLYRRIA